MFRSIQIYFMYDTKYQTRIIIEYTHFIFFERQVKYLVIFVAYIMLMYSLHRFH